MNDKEIIDLLNENPEEGMEQIITQYSGLLWAVISRHISQPEDIKECVNDTYAEFFRAKNDFDEKKGSLKNFLAVIAQRQAIKKYHENLRHSHTQNRAYEDILQYPPSAQSRQQDRYQYLLSVHLYENDAGFRGIF